MRYHDNDPKTKCINEKMSRPPKATLFPYTTLFRSHESRVRARTTARTASASARASSNTGATSPRSRYPSSMRSEEHTSELQSRFDLVCRLLLQKIKIWLHVVCMILLLTDYVALLQH